MTPYFQAGGITLYCGDTGGASRFMNVIDDGEEQEPPSILQQLRLLEGAD